VRIKCLVSATITYLNRNVKNNDMQNETRVNYFCLIKPYKHYV
jgi:hypothetical protein